MPKMFRQLPIAAASALLISIYPDVRAAIPPPEKLLPADTLLVFSIPDFAALRADAKQSPQWLFWSDPAMKPFHDHFVGKLNSALIAPLENDLGVKFSDFESLPQGQLTFAVTQNGWDGKSDKSPGIVLLLDARDKSGLLKTNLAALTKKWTDAGKDIRTETVRGIPFSVVTLSSNDVPGALTNIFPRPQPEQELGAEPKPETPHVMVVGQFQSLLIAGNSIAAVAPVVAHLTGSSMPALADDATFAADQLAQFHDSPLEYGWFNTKVFFNVLAVIPPAAPNPEAPAISPAPQWDKIVSALGLTAVKSASFACRETHAGAQVNLFIATPESTRQGIFKMLAPETKTAVPPPFVPADATKFWRCRVDGAAGWQTFQDILNNISPSALIGLNAAIDMANVNAQQRDPGFDIRKNLFKNLGDDFIAYQKAPASGTVEAPALFLFGAPSGDRAVAAINTLASMLPASAKAPEPRDFQGHKIYSLPLPAPHIPGTPAAAPSRFLYCAVGGGYVGLTTDISMLEGFLRAAENPPKPLSSVPGLLDAAQRVGGAGTGLFGYENQRELLRPLFKALKESDGGGASSLAIVPKGIRDWMDFSLLPDYGAVSKYFYFTVYAASATPDGITFKTFAPRPPELN